MTPTEATAVVHDGFQRVTPPASETMALQVAVSAQHLCIVANTENEVHCRPRASDGAPSWRQIKNAVAWISLSSETLWSIGTGNNNNKGLAMSYNSVVQCSGSTANGRRCDFYGQINAGGSFFFCRHHFICRGKTQDGRACSRAVASGIYCCAAHNPALNRYRSSEFRDDGLMLSRWQVLQRHNFLDYYTDAELDEIETHRDHIVECQVAAHVFNGLYRVYRQNGWDEEEIDAAVPMVSYFLNGEANVVPVHEDINILKGSGVTSFLEERAIYGYARFTPHLLHAHERLSDRQLGRMLWTSIGRATAYSIKKAVWKQLEELEHMLDSQADCETMGDLATHVGSLRRNVKNS
ncbi:hypothetical protein ATCC90586_006047 [Pythium insidiosum]|nr:hypothetical protein ATCC90586_006047 [Pythium insidiosum]